MDAKIIAIEHPGNHTGEYPVAARKGKPVDPRLPLWQRRPEGDRDGATKKNIPDPVLLRIDRPGQAALRVTVAVEQGLPGEDLFLEGVYGPQKHRLFYGKPIETDKEKGRVVFQVECLYTPDGFFKLTGKGIQWRLGRPGSGEYLDMGEVLLEIYWLYGDPYDYFPKGIPLEILEELAGACGLNGQLGADQFDHTGKKIKVNPDPSGLSTPRRQVARVVEHCFNRNPPRFNIWRGDAKFRVSKNHYAYVLLVNQYLNAREDPNALCNCIDQAGMLEYFLRAMGIEEVEVRRLGRFGNLNRINLVGRGETNNPYYGGATGCAQGVKIVDDDCKERTSFENHYYCAAKIDGEWRILDSCIGPFTGDLDKTQYLARARDGKKPKGGTVEVAVPEDIILPGEPIPKEATPSPRITFLVNRLPDDDEWDDWLPEQYTATRSRGTAEAPGRFLVRQWPDLSDMDAIGAPKGWRQIFEEVVPGKTRVLKTWKLVKDSSTITVKLYISHIDPRPQPLSRPGEWMAWEPRLQPRGIATNPGDFAGISSDYHYKKNHNFSVRVYFQDIKSEDRPFVEALKKGLDDLLADSKDMNDIRPAKDLPEVHRITCSTTVPQEGQTVTVKIPVQKDVQYDFYMTRKPRKNVDTSKKGLKFIADHTHPQEGETGQEVRSLDFITLPTDTADPLKLVILAVHKKTLLLNSTHFSITVPVATTHQETALNN